ncbi:hypothetical protein HK107_09245 [Parvularcula sp. ZS-1/3]|uniref:Polysaccharide export protein N-terminal domain-containing protein n=1 Tax=Parvularcula mediterranea TaxID=2732508 RepID=A0A7Y3RLW4_9PROT|nr:polysaccharide biosynthesis/export family protein [Parvularcula mediterranea]NNU16503.1 hypothetical protein [Parvularcula mediterranea]
MTHPLITRAGRFLAFAALLPTFAGCASVRLPENDFESAPGGSAYMAEWRSEYRRASLDRGWAEEANSASCVAEPLPADAAALPLVPSKELSAEPVLAPGDLLILSVEDDVLFSGSVVVAQDGTIGLRHAGPVAVAGLTLRAAGQEIEERLVAAEIYKPGYASVSLRVAAWAPVDVAVEGAVFQPGIVTVNDIPAEAVRTEKVEAAGDHALQRRLSAALRSAAGARPDADLSRVILVRQGRRSPVDLTGIIAGGAAEDPFLEAGDRIIVPGRGCYDQRLARPSPVTPPGIRIFLSNLTAPARANAPSAIGENATRVPYGTTMFQALFSANCVGGTQVTNAGRFAVLATRDPRTGEEVVIQRAIEDLVRRNDRREFNPVLMPNDSVACYDSVVTNVRDVLATIGEVAGPALLTVGIAGAAQ